MKRLAVALLVAFGLTLLPTPGLADAFTLGVHDQGADPATVATPARGQSLGQGIEEGCAEGRSTTSSTPIEVFAIPGVAPTEAVTIQLGSLLIVHGGTVPSVLVHAK